MKRAYLSLASALALLSANSATATPVFLPADKGALTPALYPNPAKGVVYIVADKTSLYTISDVQGKMLFSGIVQPGTNSVNIGSLRPGLYFIRMSDRTFKLLINQRKNVISKERGLQGSCSFYPPYLRGT